MTRSHIVLALAVVIAVGAPDTAASAHERGVRASGGARLGRLVEANVVATHAYQVLLARRSGKGDASCFGPGALTDVELGALVDHQARLLKTDTAEVRAWARGARSRFDPSTDVEPILMAGLAVPDGVPVNVVTRYL